MKKSVQLHIKTTIQSNISGVTCPAFESCRNSLRVKA